MRSWPVPEVPTLDGTSVPLSLYDTADQCVREVEGAGMYVCGITPYDSTHLGHAATYLTFDLVYRQLLDNGQDVTYAQNITDVDDPLFERAQRDGVDWRELGTSQIDLFRSDMAELSVIPPQHYIGAMEAIDDVIGLVSRLLEAGAAYVVDDADYPDVYAHVDATKQFGYASNYTPDEMASAFAERGGDPDRPGKLNPLDPLLWRAQREGEPAWESPFGPGRPGWHVECSSIAEHYLGTPFAIQGGGSDLAFPHHEFSAAHAEAAGDIPRMAGHYVHTGMIGLEGTKMSKSLGNLVFVHKLTAAGHEASAIRLGVFAGHYRSDRDWSDAVLKEAEDRLARWRSGGSDWAATTAAVAELRKALANDLDTPKALEIVDAWAQGPGADPEATKLMATALNALLGVHL
ncbi:cysteine--1-D-myo-inosityl 2-amino-2-deoxy-alpha-D-glucopyranoside ligase [Corynebacterium tapiri]|uniref:L-cysteine:1D-myo-inositol 2-amino-2-deoxy-alpha-D-glucopyranoside ligase n=1 Tax=Corynebacterium tapiri TaxID=1448266 RepID=A0A5C4U4W5_9CORY|nr:cysteine--1-D-myo-inosityl 2-amino-2-deoxy-alpha-D-glucopyranoside ligase [Corynebacterium tapiri]TNL97602.1 cysteine--1-D-myo-inosityl 2-amino-2-deoxy-alpha-D-glucopyranoside ligase [Corynebacterium tapiri]